MFCLGGIYMGAAEPYQPHPTVGLRFVEISRHASDDVVGQLVGKDAVHDFGAQSMHELCAYRLGGPYSDKRCFAMMDDAAGVLHSAIYVHVGKKPIKKYTDLAGDVMPILTSTPNTFEGRPQSFHCYSISAQLSGLKRVGPVLVGNLHHFLTTNYPNAVISTLSPMRKFDDYFGLKDRMAWAQENDSYRLQAIFGYLATCSNDVQQFHMGNGATIGAIRLSTPEGVGDSLGMNRCMVNYIYHRDPEVLKRNAAKFKEICKNGGSIIDAGLVAPELVQQVYGMAETYGAARPNGYGALTHQ